MKPKANILYKCVLCGNEVNYLHEIYFGRFRQLSIKYNLQIPVCHCAHPHKVHHSGQSLYYRLKFCEIMGIENEEVFLALNTNYIPYLEKIATHMEKKLISMRV